MIALYTVPRDGTLGILFEQVLGLTKHHNERALLNVKTRHNGTSCMTPVVQQIKGHCSTAHCRVVVCLFDGRVYKIGPRIQRCSDNLNTIVYYHPHHPHTMSTSANQPVCICCLGRFTLMRSSGWVPPRLVGLCSL